MIKFWDLGIDFFFGSRLQDSDADLGFGCRFLFRIKIIYKKVIVVWDVGVAFFLGSRLQEIDQDCGFGY